MCNISFNSKHGFIDTIVGKDNIIYMQTSESKFISVNCMTEASLLPFTNIVILNEMTAGTQHPMWAKQHRTLTSYS